VQFDIPAGLLGEIQIGSDQKCRTPLLDPLSDPFQSFAHGDIMKRNAEKDKRPRFRSRRGIFQSDVVILCHIQIQVQAEIRDQRENYSLKTKCPRGAAHIEISFFDWRLYPVI
jgi:hypothetical protein